MRLILSDRPFDLDLNGQEQTKFIDLSTLRIGNCVGCFCCWTKTPGKCVIRDDATKVYPYIAKSDEVMYISRIRYGGYDTVMKTMLERAIPIQQAFIRLVDGETHHVQRAVAGKKATIIVYGENVDESEKEVFERLISRNARNMNFEEYRIIFASESDIAETVGREVEKWKK